MTHVAPAIARAGEAGDVQHTSDPMKKSVAPPTRKVLSGSLLFRCDVY